MIFVAAEVTKLGSVSQRKFQRLNRVIKAHESDRAGQRTSGAQDRYRIGRRTEAHVPKHEFAGVLLEPFAEPELVDIKRLGFGDRADDGMKSFAVRQRMKTVLTIGELDEFVSSAWHAAILDELQGEIKT